MRRFFTWKENALKQFDYLVIPCARIGVDKIGRMRLSSHMNMRAQSAAYMARDFPSAHLIICGGFCIGKRYPLTLDEPLIQPANYSAEAARYASQFPSESAFVAMWLNDHPFAQNQPGVSFERMTLDQESRTTTENAECATDILNASCHKTHDQRTGVISMVYHLLRPRENCMEVFTKTLTAKGFAPPIPVFTEEVLYRENRFWLEHINNFYQEPQSGFHWDANEICRRLKADESLEGITPTKAA